MCGDKKRNDVCMHVQQDARHMYTGRKTLLA